MKILFFSSYFFPYISGLTVYPKKILDYLSKKNYITVLTFSHENNLRHKETLKRLKIVRLPYFFRLSKGFISPQSLFLFIQYIKNNDLLLLNLPNFEGLALAFFGKIFNKKVISIYHCQVFLDKSLFSKIIFFFLNTSVLLQCWLSNVIIAHVEYVNYIDIGKIFRSKIKTVFPPIEKAIVNNKELFELIELKKNNVWIGYSGRMASEKGLEYLINAVKIIRNSNVLKTELIFVGPKRNEVVGEKKYYDRIMDILKKNNMKCFFLGKLADKQMGAFYKSIDIFVLPSINRTEAFGMAQVEAMLCGTPVVASDLPGVRVPIQLTKMGIITPPKDSMAIAEAITTIINNRDKYTNKQLIANAKSIFNINKTYRFYERIISTL